MIRPRISRALPTALPAALLACLAAGPAWAQTTLPDATADNVDFFTGIMRRPALLGDIGGLRPLLGTYGVTLSLTEVSEILGNVTGGLKRGATYDGLTTLTLLLDTQKAFGWDGGTLNISALQIHGRNFSQYYLANLQTASGIAATPTTRLWEVWYQQSVLDGKLDVKLGQQSLDQEFMVSAGSALFLNTMMGWPMLPSADLYAGGPAYPLSSLGVRVRAQPGGGFTALAGVFQDNPPGGSFARDPQLLGASRWGGNFNLRTGALVMGELQYAFNQPAAGDMDDGTQPAGLPGTYKIGFWYDTARYPSQRLDDIGLSLADPASSGNPKRLGGNYSFYAVADQMLWRPDPKSPQSVNVFARIMGAPGDRNLVDFSLNAGVTLKAPFDGRDGDSFGIGYGLARVGSGARSFDQAAAFFAGTPGGVRSSESFVEVTYQAQITPWLQVQPDFQYVFLPGGGIADPNTPGKRIRNEAVLGIRANITF